MAHPDHIAQLMKGVTAWNAWRDKNHTFRPDLKKADLSWADLRRANLIEADLSRAHLGHATLTGADLSDAILTGAHLTMADLKEANLSNANLSEAKLWAATLVNTDLTGADLTNCRIYGVSAWGLKLEGAKQQNLIITPMNEPEITVDNIEVGQFIHLLLHNQKIRHVIDTITSKVVLILGRFTDERKAVLDALREELRKREYLPVLFDFFRRYPWVLEPCRYDSQEYLLVNLEKSVVDPVEAKVLELRAPPRGASGP